MENPYVIPAKPDKDDYSTVKGDSRHWKAGAYTEYTDLLADYEKQLASHRLWDEGNIAGKAEQAEIVRELVEAGRKALEEFLKANPYDRREVRFPSEAEQAIARAVEKASQ